MVCNWILSPGLFRISANNSAGASPLHHRAQQDRQARRGSGLCQVSAQGRGREVDVFLLI